MLTRLLSVAAGLVRFVVFVALTLACGWSLGGVVGLQFVHDFASGSRWGLGVGSFFALCGYADSLGAPGVGAFLASWFRGTFAAELAIACAVSTHFAVVRIAPRFHPEWDPFLLRLGSGALALLVWLPIWGWIIASLFGNQTMPVLVSRVISGGLTTAQTLVARARNLRARRPRRP